MMLGAMVKQCHNATRHVTPADHQSRRHNSIPFPTRMSSSRKGETSVAVGAMRAVSKVLQQMTPFAFGGDIAHSIYLRASRPPGVSSSQVAAIHLKAKS